MKDIERHKNLILDFIKREDYIPMKPSEMAFFMEVPHQSKHEFNDVIDRLEKNGEIIVTKRGKIMLPEQVDIVKGVFQSNNKGFGFVMPDITRENDIFVAADNTNGAMHKDTVLVKVTSNKENSRRAEGEIIKIIARGLNTIVGIYEKNQKNPNFGFVSPRDQRLAQDIFIASKDAMNAVTGHVVEVKIIKPGNIEQRINPEGKIIDILGHINDPGVDILSVIKQFELPVEFPLEVVEEVKQADYSITDKELQRRTDLRDVVMVTIDGEDSKDLDDAVSLEIIDGIYRLGVHIADVSHYVTEGSPLDKEALKRGTSVYLVDRVIPMLPYELSNGVCSLNAGADRLSLSCIMDIDEKGNVLSHKIVESVIHINQRMSYKGVNEALAGNEPYVSDYAPFLPMLEKMGDLRNILREKRIKRGAIEFGFAEAKIILNDEGIPMDIIPAKRSFSSGIIEEFMLVCNETVAEQYFWLELPFVYRTHEEPDREKIEKLAEFVSKFGYYMKGKVTHAKSIQKLISEFEGTDEEAVISRVALRSLKQARYSYECEGHFGLAAKYYCHFTSPIRRYPDLQIHRIIKEHLNSRLNEQAERHFYNILPDVCKSASLLERRAEDAEREVDHMKKVQFMADKIGWEFEGFISSVTNWGIYVELPNTVEGMISLNDMNDDYYIYEDKNYRVVGERTGKVYELGQRVRVILVNAGLESMKLDFILADS